MTSISKRNKRTSLHQKYKVAKKVRQHHKKTKQILKKQKAKKEKTVSIPMDVPFREDILKGVEIANLQEKIMKTKRMKTLNKIKSKGKVNDFETLKLKLLKDPRKSFIHDVRKVLDTANIIIEVLDARDPIGTRSLEAEKEIKLLNKPLLIVLNKIDLVPVENLNLWLNHLSKEAKVFPFKSSCQKDDIKFKSEIKIQKKSKPGNVYGADELLNHIKSLMQVTEGLGVNIDKIVVGVIGLPNTGKSSVVNSLKMKRVCVVGENPTITRSLQNIDLNDKITIIDSPSIVISSENNAVEIIERNCISVKLIVNPTKKAEFIFDRCNKSHLCNHYELALVDKYEIFMVALAKRLNILKKGGVPDLTETARRIFNDWNNGKLAHWAQPPMTPEDDKCLLSAEQRAIIKKLESKYVSDSAGFSVVESSGPLKTFLNVDEVTDQSCDDECGEEDCHGCDDGDCDGCDDGDCEGCDDDSVDMDE